MKIIFLFLFLLTGAKASVNLSEETLHSYFKENPEVRSLKERLEASEKLRGSLTRSFLPKVELSYGRERYSVGPYNHVNQPFGGIQASINVFNSGKDALENDKRDFQARVSEIDAVVLEAQVVNQIRKDMAYYAFLEEVSAITAAALENNGLNMRSARSRVKAGLSAETDTLDFEQQDIVLKQQMSALNFEKGVTGRMLLTLLGTDPKEEIVIKVQNQHPEHEQKMVINSNPENSLAVKRSLFLSEVARIEMKEAKRWWTPSVDVYGFAVRALQKDREYPLPSQRNDAGIGFKITMPIFDGGTGYRLGQANSAIAKSQDSLAQARKLSMQKEMLDAQMKLELAQELIHGAENNVRVMTKYRKGILEEYNRGVKNSPDVLQANIRWMQANTQFAEVKKNYQIARAEALYLFGISERK
jgi:outer membrane protein TolC